MTCSTRKSSRTRRAADRGLERAPDKVHADAVLADDRRRDHGTLLVSLGPLPGVFFGAGGINARGRCSFPDAGLAKQPATPPTS